MKSVLLLRHAKSDWGNMDLADFDRPLAKRGLKDAPRIGRVIADYDSVPDLILASPARRARQTTKMVAKACGYRKSISWQDSFYGGDSDDLIAALQHLPNSVEQAMLVGHNPTMEDTVSTLLLGYDAVWERDFTVRIPTAGLICLDLAVEDWPDLEPGDAILRWFLIPRLIKAIE
jgi:phosphohistidine phosphatase